MEEQLISFETAKLAKEKGFVEKVYAFYKNPTDRGTFKEGTLDYAGSDYDPETFEEIIFDYNTLNSHYYEDKEYFSAPTQSLLQRWLREVHNINIYVAFCEYVIISENNWKFSFDNPTKQQYWRGKFNSHEEALEAGLQEALKLI